MKTLSLLTLLMSFLVSSVAFSSPFKMSFNAKKAKNQESIIIGTPGNDILNGTNGDDTILGLGGDDVINTGNGDNYIDGGHGADTVISGTGTNTILYDSDDLLYDFSGAVFDLATIKIKKSEDLSNGPTLVDALIVDMPQSGAAVISISDPNTIINGFAAEVNAGQGLKPTVVFGHPGTTSNANITVNGLNTTPAFVGLDAFGTGDLYNIYTDNGQIVDNTYFVFVKQDYNQPM